jgi:hypothetical protein
VRTRRAADLGASRLAGCPARGGTLSSSRARPAPPARASGKTGSSACSSWLHPNERLEPPTYRGGSIDGPRSTA